MGAILFMAGLDQWRIGVGVTTANLAKWNIPLPELAGPSWDAGRLDLMFVACGLLLWLHGPGRAAVQRT